MAAKAAGDDDDEFLVATEWDDVLTNANETDMVELAGQTRLAVVRSHLSLCLSAAILGFTGLINQVQYHAVIAEKGLSSNAGGWNCMRDE